MKKLEVIAKSHWDRSYAKIRRRANCKRENECRLGKNIKETIQRTSKTVTLRRRN